MVILPAYQRKGIGSQPVRTDIEECRPLGYEIIVVLGHPDYYPHFGFVPTMPKGISYEFKVPEEAWITLDLREGALAGRWNKVKFRSEFSEV